MRLTAALFALATLVFAQEVSKENLERHVRKLASDEFAGRRGEGARKAEKYIHDAFTAAGLKTQVQELPGRGTPLRNVIGVLRSGKEPTQEHVIVSAHYDHLGKWGGFLFPGASDNAAGVAALLELARVLKPPLKRDVIFIAFDQEEIGLVGSFGYTQQPLRPLKDCAAFLTFDILGRDLADVTKGVLFCVGTERADTLLDVVKGTKVPEGVTMVYAGADIVGARSDFVPFMQKKVPFLFFSTGESMDYHQPTDTPDKVDYGKLHREAQVIVSVTRSIIEAPRAKFLDEPAAHVEEAATLAVAIAQMLAQRKKLGLSDFEAGLGKMFLANLQRIEKNGKMTPIERKQIVMVCKQLISMLQRKR